MKLKSLLESLKPKYSFEDINRAFRPGPLKMNNNHKLRFAPNDRLPWRPLRWDQPLEDQYENKYNLDIQDQINEDTCEEHGVFCCDKCFDMRPVDEDENDV